MLARTVFFNKVRVHPFNGNLSQKAVDGCNAILDEWERRGLTDMRWLAYMLATVLAECGLNMSPVREGFKLTDADSRFFVAKRNYKYAKVVNGQVYYGRGLVQLTWDYNYKTMGELLGINLLANPDLALSLPVAVRIMFEGMIRGKFTGKKLADFFSTGADFYNARTIINGHDRAGEIEGYAKAFLLALEAAKLITPLPPDIQPPKPKEEKATPNNKTGAGGAVIVGGGGAVIINEAKKKGAETGDLILAGVLIAVIAGAVFLIIRQWRRS